MTKRFYLAQSLEVLGRPGEARAEYERLLGELAQPGLPPFPPGLSIDDVRRRIAGLTGGEGG